MTPVVIYTSNLTMHILVYFLYLLYHTAMAQFQPHIDFQKMGELNVKNGKYNVLRPTLHVVKDYFTDVMMRRDTSDFPTQTVLIDRNGFRHYWSGFEEEMHNSRKSDNDETSIEPAVKVDRVTVEKIRQDVAKREEEIDNESKRNATFKPEINKDVTLVEAKSKIIEKTENGGIIEAAENDSKDDVKVKQNKEQEHNLLTKIKQGIATKTEKGRTNISTIDDEKLKGKTGLKMNIKESNEKTTGKASDEDINFAATEFTTELVSTTKRSPKRGKKVTHKEINPYIEITSPVLRKGTKNTLVKTKFFCPFLGVITMHSIV